jgi:uncharacterized sulfatase
MEGISLLARDKLHERKRIFSEVFFHDIESMQNPVLSLKYRIIVKDEWKLILPGNRNLADSTALLYHILMDPYEQNNFAKGNPDRVNDLKNELNAWWNPE